LQHNLSVTVTVVSYRLRNDLYCVDVDVKPYSLTHQITVVIYIFQDNRFLSQFPFSIQPCPFNLYRCLRVIHSMSTGNNSSHRIFFLSPFIWRPTNFPICWASNHSFHIPLCSVVRTRHH